MEAFYRFLWSSPPSSSFNALLTREEGYGERPLEQAVSFPFQEFIIGNSFALLLSLGKVYSSTCGKHTENWLELPTPSYPRVVASSWHTFLITEQGELFSKEEDCPCKGCEWIKETLPFPVKTVSSRDNGGALITEQGALYVYGRNSCGMLGFPSEEGLWSKVPNLPVIKKVVLGDHESYLLSAQGELYATGTFNQSLSKEDYYWRLVSGLPPLRAVVSDDEQSFLITTTGELYGKGLNRALLGLGQGSTRRVRKWTKLPVPAPVKTVATGCNHSLLLTEEGRVYRAKEHDGYTPLVYVRRGKWEELPLKGIGQVYCDYFTSYFALINESSDDL